MHLFNGRAVQAGVALELGVYPGGDFGHAFFRAGLVPIAAWRSANAKPSYDLVTVLDRDTASNRYNIGQIKSDELAPAGFLPTVSAKALVRSKPKIGPIVTTV